jgi:antitoxin ParD1/3/4
MSVKSSISLTDQQDAFARRLIEQGRYPSLSAVLQNGLDLLRQKTEAEETETAALRALLEERSKGRFVPASEMEDRLNDLIAGKRQG